MRGVRSGGARERRKGECPLAFCATIVAKRSPPSLSLSRPPAPVAPDTPVRGAFAGDEGEKWCQTKRQWRRVLCLVWCARVL